MVKDAVLSPCQKFRYRLTRTWDEAKGRLCFVMLNPSTADASVDDPTIRRCMKFAEREGYGGIIVVNLFAFRATDPDELRCANDTQGEDNAKYVLGAVLEAKAVVAAWGAVRREFIAFAYDVAAMIRREGVNLLCLGKTADGHPRHPLYVKGDAPLIEWN